MDVTPFLDSLRRDLTAAADLAGSDAGQAAERMLVALEPALRLAAMELLSSAAEEASTPPGSTVGVRLRGRDPQLVVEHAEPMAERLPLLPDEDAEEADDPPARVTLRIPESVKSRAEEEAARNGLSLNAWMVGVLRTATLRRAAGVDIDVSSIPMGERMVPVGPVRSRRPGRLG